MKQVILTGFLLLMLSFAKAQADLPPARRDFYTSRVDAGKFLYGVGLTLKVDLLKRTFGYYRLSITGGAGIPFGKSLGAKYNRFAAYYFAEIDIFRGGVGAPALSRNNQKIFSELRQSFITETSIEAEPGPSPYNFTRPVMQFISNSSHPILDPFSKSLSIGTTFVNGLNIKRAQRVGIATLGYNRFLFSYLNDGPPFSIDLLPYGDGYDRWWTGSGQLGWYDPDWDLMRSIEIKYDKFTGLQRFAYELATALKIKYIPYRDKDVQLQNRTRLEFSFSSKRGIGASFNIYDMPALDLQHYIHKSGHFSYHNTPLKWTASTGIFYNNTFLIY